eukprot:s4485_g7.t1
MLSVHFVQSMFALSVMETSGGTDDGGRLCGGGQGAVLYMAKSRRVQSTQRCPLHFRWGVLRHLDGESGRGARLAGW